MNNNKKSISSVIAISLIVLIVLGIGVFFYNKTNEVSNTSQTNKEKGTISNETLTGIINKASSEIDKGPNASPEKIAYITIDDGPSKYTNKILDVLDSNDVKATFFMIDGNMKSHKDEVKRVIKGKHGLGFHSVSHDIHKLYTSPEATLNEFNTCNETLNKVSGETSKLIRLPYGSKPYMPEGSYNALTSNGYRIWDWNLDTLDWKSSTDQIVSNVLYYARERDEVVVLMHEKEQSVKALNNIIRVLNVRGYTILPITDKNSPKNFWEQNLASK